MRLEVASTGNYSLRTNLPLMLGLMLTQSLNLAHYRHALFRSISHMQGLMCTQSCQSQPNRWHSSCCFDPIWSIFQMLSGSYIWDLREQDSRCSRDTKLPTDQAKQRLPYFEPSVLFKLLCLPSQYLAAGSQNILHWIETFQSARWQSGYHQTIRSPHTIDRGQGTSRSEVYSY